MHLLWEGPIRITGLNLYHKTRKNGLRSCVILTSTIFDLSTPVRDRQTDIWTGDSVQRALHRWICCRRQTMRQVSDFYSKTLLKKTTLWLTNPIPEVNPVRCRHQVSLSEAVVVVLSSPSYTLIHSLQLTQSYCRCLHSHRNKMAHTDPTNSRTSSVERSRSTNLPPSQTVNTCLQYKIHNENNRYEKNSMDVYWGIKE